MPLAWRYLLRSYFQVFLLSVIGFIAVLLVTRFQDIAKFASASGSLSSVALYTLYQIPYILPLAVPISCLISAMILFQKLSNTHELTALRVCGMGLKAIATPLVLAGVILSFGNFVISSEVAPYCRGLSRQMIYELVAANPLVIMQKNTVIKISGAYVDMKSYKEGQLANEVILITKNTSSGRLGLMLAKQLSLKDKILYGTDVSFISSIDPKKEGIYDHLILENQKSMNTRASNLTQHMQTAEWLKNSDYLPLKLLIAKNLLEKSTEKFWSKSIGIEITKRVSIGLAAFTFTMIGICYGMEISRQKRKKGTFWAFGVAAFFMICFVATRSIKHFPAIACLAYLLPHPIILFFCLKNMRNLSRGKE